MTSEPLVCTEDPAHADDRIDDFRMLFGKAHTIERPSPQHLRLTLDASNGLDISVLAHEMRCCGWFEFTLTPTSDGTVVLDIVVPANAGRVRGAAAEQADAGTPEQILDTFAQQAVDASGATSSAPHGGTASERHCSCC